MGRDHPRRSCRRDRAPAPQGGHWVAAEPRGAGHFPRRAGYLREARQGLYGEAVGTRLRDLPAFIIKRLPVRMTFDNNYFDARLSGRSHRRLYADDRADVGGHRGASGHRLPEGEEHL